MSEDNVLLKVVKLRKWFEMRKGLFGEVMYLKAVDGVTFDLNEGEAISLVGESGSGKTVSSIKALNADDVIPILLDFDNNDSPEINQCKYIHIDGDKVIDDENIELPKNQVVIC